MSFRGNIRHFVAGVLLIVSYPDMVGAVVIPGLVDRYGNPVHTADEFELEVVTTVSLDPYGYRYSYDLYSKPTSIQDVWHFRVILPDAQAFISAGTSPWGLPGPVGVDAWGNPNPPGTQESVRWTPIPDIYPLLHPGGVLKGFSFVSPYPPGIVEAYAEGVTNGPYFDEAPPEPPAELVHRTPYGPGKVFPVIGPVRPATAGGQRYAVLGCANGLCDVQLDITGPMDPYGTRYSYRWQGPFGTATGARPVVRLAPGVHTVGVVVRDARGVVLIRARMPVAVVDSTPAGTTAPGGGRRGKDDAEGREDHDGVGEAHHEDRDDDGFPAEKPDREHSH